MAKKPTPKEFRMKQSLNCQETLIKIKIEQFQNCKEILSKQMRIKHSLKCQETLSKTILDITIIELPRNLNQNKSII